ncbi:MAG: heavy-metal-associated domain-containing protein [Anaerolineales bacterium]|nr:heavy-metal-associated domain-containing protein [Anaerolineales bacterium]
MVEKKYSVPGISCKHCVQTIQMELSDLDEVSSVKADETSKVVTVLLSEVEAESQVLNLLEEIGYPAAKELT